MPSPKGDVISDHRQDAAMSAVLGQARLASRLAIYMPPSALVPEWDSDRQGEY